MGGNGDELPRSPLPSEPHVPEPIISGTQLRSPALGLSSSVIKGRKQKFMKKPQGAEIP